MEGGLRRLTLKSCQLDQAGEVSYQALNAMTSAVLNVKGKTYSTHPASGSTLVVGIKPWSVGKNKASQHDSGPYSRS